MKKKKKEVIDSTTTIDLQIMTFLVFIFYFQYII